MVIKNTNKTYLIVYFNMEGGLYLIMQMTPVSDTLARGSNCWIYVDDKHRNHHSTFRKTHLLLYSQDKKATFPIMEPLWLVWHIILFTQFVFYPILPETFTDLKYYFTIPLLSLWVLHSKTLKKLIKCEIPALICDVFLVLLLTSVVKLLCDFCLTVLLLSVWDVCFSSGVRH